MNIDLGTVEKFRVTAQNAQRDYQIRGLALDDLVKSLEETAASENIDVTLGGPFTIAGPFDSDGAAIIEEVKTTWAAWVAAGSKVSDLKPLTGFGR